MYYDLYPYAARVYFCTQAGSRVRCQIRIHVVKKNIYKRMIIMRFK